MLISYTKHQLWQWGRWAKDSGPSLPKQSAFVSAMTGRGTAHYEPAMPEYLLEVDSAIHKLDQPDRYVIVIHFAHRLTKQEKATLLGVTPKTFYNRLNSAIWAVHSML